MENYRCHQQDSASLHPHLHAQDSLHPVDGRHLQQRTNQLQKKKSTQQHQTSPNMEPTRNTWCQDLEARIRTMKRQLERTCSATRALSVTTDRDAVYYRCSSMKSVLSRLVDEVIISFFFLPSLHVDTQIREKHTLFKLFLISSFL